MHQMSAEGCPIIGHTYIYVSVKMYVADGFIGHTSGIYFANICICTYVFPMMWPIKYIGLTYM